MVIYLYGAQQTETSSHVGVKKKFSLSINQSCVKLSMFDWKDRSLNTQEWHVSELKIEACSVNKRAEMATRWRPEKVMDGTNLIDVVMKKIVKLVLVVVVVMVMVLVAVVSAAAVAVLSEDNQSIVTFILSYRLVRLL